MITYAPAFVHQYMKLDKDLKQEAKEKIELFKDTKNHSALKVQKLKGRLQSRYGFSVNYKYRIIFQYETKNSVALLGICDHDIYK